MSEEMKEAPAEEKNIASTLADTLAAFPESPSAEKIEAWKEVHGEIFCSAFSETELFVWRPVHRTEFVEMQTEITNSQVPVSQLNVEGTVVEKCVLWSSPVGTNSLKHKAGSLTTLHEQIMQNSNFMDPRIAAQLVIKL